MLLFFVMIAVSRMLLSNRTSFNNQPNYVSNMCSPGAYFTFIVLSHTCYQCESKCNRCPEVSRTCFNSIVCAASPRGAVCLRHVADLLELEVHWSEFTCTYAALVTEAHCCKKLTAVTQNSPQHLLQNAGL